MWNGKANTFIVFLPFKRIYTHYQHTPTSTKYMAVDDNFREIVWTLIISIPQGKVMSYGQIARLAGFPSHARMVGGILKKLPAKSKIPWHRVVNAQGRISFPVDSAAYLHQRQRLEDEGVAFRCDKILPAMFVDY